MRRNTNKTHCSYPKAPLPGRSPTLIRIIISGLALFALAACADPIADAGSHAYPSFALTGDLPDRVDEFDLSIEGDDISSIEETISVDDGPYTVEIPGGDERTIELLAVDDVYSGRVTDDFAGGQEHEVTVPLRPGPVVPDPDSMATDPDGRIVQIRDISGVGWRGFGQEEDIDPIESDEYWGTDFEPTDATYDNNGRLWIADDSPGPKFIALNTLSEEDPQIVADVDDQEAAGPSEGIAVDSSNERVFYIDRAYIAETDYDDGEIIDNQLIDLMGVGVNGLTVDSEGNVIVIGPTDGQETLIQSLDPNEPGPPPQGFSLDWDQVDDDDWVESWSENNPDQWSDVKYSNGYVYVTNANADPGSRVIRIDPDLDPGSVVPVQEPADDEFLGPRRFAAKHEDSEMIFVTDEEDWGESRLVGFSDADGSDWTTLEANPDDETDTFDFFVS